ncbi:MAG TPA: YqaE/Pmp3 family membrane protein [Xanthomarina sp.]|nr:YqaE/Pmp3 family membrane protein [Xanthomarina sp.]
MDLSTNKYISSINPPLFFINVGAHKLNQMSFWRVLLSIICPPLAVIDKGCGSIVIVFLLWLCGWVPGVIAALVILNNPKN